MPIRLSRASLWCKCRAGRHEAAEDVEPLLGKRKATAVGEKQEFHRIPCFLGHPSILFWFPNSWIWPPTPVFLTQLGTCQQEPPSCNILDFLKKVNLQHKRLGHTQGFCSFNNKTWKFDDFPQSNCPVLQDASHVVESFICSACGLQALLGDLSGVRVNRKLGQQVVPLKYCKGHALSQLVQRYWKAVDP